jgi:hypothetical protein
VSEEQGHKIVEAYRVMVKNYSEIPEAALETLTSNTQFVITICENEIYKQVKQNLYSCNLPSQNIRPSTLRKKSGIFSIVKNVMNQINNKLGNDTYHVKFSPEIKPKSTMVIGIDVCHAGS